MFININFSPHKIETSRPFRYLIRVKKHFSTHCIMKISASASVVAFLTASASQLSSAVAQGPPGSPPDGPHGGPPPTPLVIASDITLSES